jgi:hypothetical protein
MADKCNALYHTQPPDPDEALNRMVRCVLCVCVCVCVLCGVSCVVCRVRATWGSTKNRFCRCAAIHNRRGAARGV